MAVALVFTFLPILYIALSVNNLLDPAEEFI